MEKLRIMEPVKVKEQIIKSATETANMILRIDNVVASSRGSAMPPPPGGGCLEWIWVRMRLQKNVHVNVVALKQYQMYIMIFVFIARSEYINNNKTLNRRI